MIRVVIVDDEFPTRQELSSILQNINDVDIVAQCSIGQELLDYLANNVADIVFAQKKVSLGAQPQSYSSAV